MPKVSVITALYNAERYIEKCVVSLFEQTMTDVEFIFVDDCSTDNSFQVLSEISGREKYQGVNTRLLRLTHNSGCSLARKSGMEVAEGDYIIFFDIDDWVESNMLELMYESITDNKADICVSDYYVSRENSESRHKGMIHTDVIQYTKDLLLKNVPSGLWNKMIKRSLFDTTIIFPTKNIGEDIALFIQLLNKTDRLTHVSTPLYHYCFNEESLSHKINRGNIESLFKDALSNAAIVNNLLSNNKSISRELNSFIWIERSYILPFIDDYDCRLLWKNTFPENTLRFLLNSCFSLKYKAGVILYLSGVKSLRKKLFPYF